jgi:murein L,D-transpeptidase YcbB/YkuD
MIVAKHNVFHKAIMGCALISLLASCSLSNATTDDVISAIQDAQASVATTQETQAKIQSLLPAGVSPYYLSTLSALYAANNMKPMWQDAQAVKEFEQQLGEAALAGFQPQFAEWIKQLNNPDVKDMARDIILSDAMLGYLQYVNGVEANGKRWLYQKTPYKPEIPAAEVIAQWQVASKNGEKLNQFVASLAPQQADYAPMRKAMMAFLQDDTPWPMIKFKKTIRVGNAMSQDDIVALQNILNRTAEWSGNELLKVTVDESGGKKYTKTLSAALKEFQTIHGLANDGSLGKQTVNWLNKLPQERAAIMALNMQRLRLLPVKYDTNIMVNIPAFSMTYYVNGTEALSSRVIVGRPERKTPLMENALTNVVINPPWNVPTKLIREDIVPKLKRDPNYLKRQGYTVYSGWGRGSEVVDTSAIDWSEVSPKDVNFRFQQSPGGGNSLGRYKFNMPNSEAIYLHDTPNHRTFERSNRAMSSGCVRVNQSAQLASMLLNQVDGWDDGRIKNTLKGGRTTHVNLNAQVPVQLYYMTAWVSNGRYPQFRNDIYYYDTIAANSMKNLTQIKTLLR